MSKTGSNIFVVTQKDNGKLDILIDGDTALREYEKWIKDDEKTKTENVSSVNIRNIKSEMFPLSIIQLENTENLIIENFENMNRLASYIHSLDHLKNLYIKNCKNLDTITSPHSSDGWFKSIESVTIEGCNKLKDDKGARPANRGYKYMVIH